MLYWTARDSEMTMNCFLLLKDCFTDARVIVLAGQAPTAGLLKQVITDSVFSGVLQRFISCEQVYYRDGKNGTAIIVL